MKEHLMVSFLGIKSFFFYCLPLTLYRWSCQWTFWSKIWWNKMNRLTSACQTIKAELSESFCQKSVHRGQMAERAKGEKETDDRKGKNEWGMGQDDKMGGLGFPWHSVLSSEHKPHTCMLTKCLVQNQSDFWLSSYNNMIKSILVQSHGVRQCCSARFCSLW